MTVPNEPVPPVVCMLSIGARADRELEWSDLAGLALTSERLDNGIVSTFPLGLADAIDDLVEREQQCCGSWLDASVAAMVDSVRLELTTSNPEGVALIMSMAGVPGW
jgi:hypothetical protein